MRCPMCEDAVLQVSHRHGIEVDTCPRCKGIWLDRGELEKILDALDAQLDEVAAGRPATAGSPLPPPPAVVHPPVGDPTGRHDGSWTTPEVRSGPARAAKSPPPGWKKAKKSKKHKSVLAALLDEVL